MKPLAVLAILAAGCGAARAAQPAAPAAAAEEPGAVSARASSGYMVSIIKMGMKRQPSPKMDEACIAAIDESALSPQYRAFFKAHFSGQEIAELDAFYGSDAGRKFLADGLQEVERRKYGADLPRVEFSPEETAQIQRATASAGWKKYGEMVLKNGPEWKREVGVDYLELIVGCKREDT